MEATQGGASANDVLKTKIEEISQSVAELVRYLSVHPNDIEAELLRQSYEQMLAELLNSAEL